MEYKHKSGFQKRKEKAKRDEFMSKDTRRQQTLDFFRSNAAQNNSQGETGEQPALEVGETAAVIDNTNAIPELAKQSEFECELKCDDGTSQKSGLDSNSNKNIDETI